MFPRNSIPEGFSYIWQSKWVGIIAMKTARTQIHFLSDVLVAVASLDLKVPNSRRVWIHEKNSGDAVRRLGTMIQRISCAQSGASIRLTVWKRSGESRYPGAFPPVLENFRRAFSPGPTDCPWVSEDGWWPVICMEFLRSFLRLHLTSLFNRETSGSVTKYLLFSQVTVSRTKEYSRGKHLPGLATCLLAT